ncbi:unnamed protein product [Toxocara canis]|uniref:EF-hand domain-containing protein n=1 Tax=Toxocara canis TaxID=6265 RepID=A0A183UK20_TOXCA|nr:unnamed protein product [Toxocara canis]
MYNDYRTPNCSQLPETAVLIRARTEVRTTVELWCSLLGCDCECVSTWQKLVVCCFRADILSELLFLIQIHIQITASPSLSAISTSLCDPVVMFCGEKSANQMKQMDDLTNETERLFDLCDRENKGYLTVNDLKVACPQLDGEARDAEIDFIFASLDADSSGRIDRHEFLGGFQNALCKGESKDKFCISSRA